MTQITVYTNNLTQELSPGKTKYFNVQDIQYQNLYLDLARPTALLPTS